MKDLEPIPIEADRIDYYEDLDSTSLICVNASEAYLRTLLAQAFPDQFPASQMHVVSEALEIKIDPGEIITDPEEIQSLIDNFRSSALSTARHLSPTTCWSLFERARAALLEAYQDTPAAYQLLHTVENVFPAPVSQQKSA